MHIKRMIFHYSFPDCKTIILILSLTSLIITYNKIEKLKAEYENDEDLNNNKNNARNPPMVFIGGSPRSGNVYFCFSVFIENVYW